MGNSKIYKWYQEEALPGGTAPTVVHEERGWQPPQPPRLPKFLWQPPDDPHSIVALTVVEEESWTPPQFAASPILWSPLIDTQWVPAPSFTVPEDDTWQAPFAASTFVVPQVVWADEQIVPQPAGSLIIEEDWFAPKYKYEQVNYIFWVTQDEITPQVVTSIGGGVTKDSAKVLYWPQGDDFVQVVSSFAPTEDYWQINLTAKTTPVSLPTIEDAFVTQPQLVYEEDWSIPQVYSQAVRIYIPGDNEFYGIPPTPLPVEDEYWLKPWYPQPKPKLPSWFICQNQDETPTIVLSTARIFIGLGKMDGTGTKTIIG